MRLPSSLANRAGSWAAQTLLPSVGLGLAARVSENIVSPTGAPAWLAPAVTVGAAALGTKKPGLLRALRPVAVSGGVGTYLDTRMRSGLGYSSLDNASLSKHVEQSVGDRLGGAADNLLNKFIAKDDISSLTGEQLIQRMKQYSTMRDMLRQRQAAVFPPKA